MLARFFFVLCFFCVELMTTPAVSRSYAALVMNGQGKVLHQVNAYAPVYPASLTKMMTLYMVFEALHKKKLRLSDRVYFSAHAASRPPCKLPLRAGECLTVKQAILGLITKSANDAAAALAEKLGGTESAFAKKMSLKARQLGLHQTTFRNASGLFHTDQKTTAYDMALLGRALVNRFPAEYRYFNTKNFVLRGVVYKNHNQLLGQIPGCNNIKCDGIKTGFVEKSGFNIVASVKRGTQRIFVVLVGGETWRSRDQHVAALIHAAYHKPEALPLITAKACPPVFAEDASQRLVKREPCQQASIDALLTLSDQSNRS